VLAAGLVLLAGLVGLVVVFVFFPGNLAGSRIKGASSSGGGSSLGTIVGLFVVVVGVVVGFGSVVVLAVLFVLVVVVLLVAAVVVLLVFDLLFVSDPATGLVSTFVSGLLFTPVSGLVSGLVSGAEVSAVFMVLVLVLLVGFAGVVYGSGCYIFFCALAARVCALDITLL
jgi:hypothetical protein